jgi:hypothetical protein
MKRINRKLNLRVETVRNLSGTELRRAAGGMSSERAGVCSTMDDTNCVATNRISDCLECGSAIGCVY